MICTLLNRRDTLLLLSSMNKYKKPVGLTEKTQRKKEENSNMFSLLDIHVLHRIATMCRTVNVLIQLIFNEYFLIDDSC